MSITADIRKSSFYGGIDQITGRAQLHYPNEQIYIMTIDKEDNNVGSGDPALTIGNVYQQAIDTEAFEEYHRQAEDAMWEDDLDDLEHQPQHKSRGCWKNNHKDPVGALPPAKYHLAVDASVYRRIFDEIAQSNQMPCGLFFCGHHEDIAHPSIWMAIVPIVFLLVTMGILAWNLRV